MRHLPIWIWLALVLSLQGCQTYGDVKRDNALEQTLSTYAETARWGNLDSLYAMLEPALAVKAQVPANLSSVRVVKYEVLEPAAKLNEETAAQAVAIDFVFVDEQVLHTLVDRQLWVFDPEEKVWRRGNAIPEFR